MLAHCQESLMVQIEVVLQGRRVRSARQTSFVYTAVRIRNSRLVAIIVLLSHPSTSTTFSRFQSGMNVSKSALVWQIVRSKSILHSQNIPVDWLNIFPHCPNPERFSLHDTLDTLRQPACNSWMLLIVTSSSVYMLLISEEQEARSRP